jgi:hypothetical protein
LRLRFGPRCRANLVQLGKERPDLVALNANPLLQLIDPLLQEMHPEERDQRQDERDREQQKPERE